MAVAGAQIAGSTNAAEAARDWQAMRADGDIQYAPVAPPKPLEDPAWMKDLMDWLGPLFKPIGEALGIYAPAFFKVLIALAILLALWILWRLLLQPLLERTREARQRAEPEWAPDRDAAVALLSDADGLAAQGRYAEAVHLLLQRSVGHISDARPDWLMPASTAREIAAFAMLPDRARQAFGAIATRVERSLFALRDLDMTDWTAARAAYADFALADLKTSDLET